MFDISLGILVLKGLNKEELFKSETIFAKGELR